MVILWTYPERSCIVQSADAHITNKFKRFIPADSDDPATKHFYTLYDDYDANVDLYTRIEYADLHFKKRGIKVLHFLVSKRMIVKFSWSTAKIEKVFMNDISLNFSPALDNEHPGKLAHYKFAEDVITILNNTSVVDS